MENTLPHRPTTPEEEAHIQAEFDALLREYAHTRNGDKAELIRRVFEFARRAHGDSRRLSGEPYICHPLAVARIVCSDIGLGSTSISGALLHDVVKNTDTTLDDIEAAFGPRISGLVRDLSKISGGNLRFVADDGGETSHFDPQRLAEQAENFRNLLLTIAQDVRVILVKIADRLHNMRTLDAIAEEKQQRIARETLYLFAPLAYRLGLFSIKSELEDLSLRYEHPDEYADLKRKLQESEESRQRIFTTFSAPIVSLLDDLGLAYSFKCRMKSIYSIWRKMKQKQIPFDEVYDLFAARIVFRPESEATEKTDCWRIYTAITTVYKIHPDRIRDWISHPKSNGYEALHVTVMGPDGNWIEIQIRSERMNEIAEKGLAAHWKYKRGQQVAEGDNELDKWVKNIKEILDNPAPNATDFLDTINLNLLSTEIYVFTPKGNLQELPKGATALDFAFSLHTSIGLHAEAARINHQLAPLSTVLHNGEQVEILTAEVEKVSEEWLGWVSTAKARSRVRSWLNRQRQAVIEQGHKMLEEYLAAAGLPLDNPAVVTLLNRYKLQHWEELFTRIATGALPLTDHIRKLVRPKKRNALLGFFSLGKGKKKKEASSASPSRPNSPSDKAGETFPKPLPKGSDLYDGNIAPAPAPVREGRSGGTGKSGASTTIELTGIDGRGLLNTITRVISETITANILNVHLECKDGLFKGYLTLDTDALREVQKLCAALKKVHEIERAAKIN